MENVRMFVPECLREFKVDWSKYTPAGGWDWQEMFHSSFTHEIDDRVRALKSLVAEAKLFRDGRKEILHGLEVARKTLGRIKGQNSICLDGSIGGWLESAPVNIEALSKSISSVDGEEDTIQSAESEINFLNSVVAYFTKDLEFDMLMWALDEIPVRNRTKVFRYAARLLNEILDLKNVVENAHGETADAFRERIAQPLSDLAVGYAKMPLVIKAIRKSIDRKGELAWSGDDLISASRLRSECADACRQVKWVA